MTPGDVADTGGSGTLRASHGDWEVHDADDGTVLVIVNGAEMRLGVGCTGNVPTVVLTLHRGSFADGDVSAYWDGGENSDVSRFADYLFRRIGGDRLGFPGRDFIGRLQRHDGCPCRSWRISS